MSKTKTADDYIDSTLYAKTLVTAYASVDANGNGVNKAGVIQPRKLVGHVYAWVQHNGHLWWMVDQNTFPEHQYIFVEHKQGRFIQPTDVWQPPKIEKPLSEQLLTYAKYAAIGFAGVYLLKSVLVAKIEKPKTKKALA